MLDRMVVPGKGCGRFGPRGRQANGIEGGGGWVRGPIVGATGVVSHASFVPVGTGAAGGAGATAGAAVAGGAALTVAAPLVLMAVAVGASARAEQQRREAIEHITELLEQLYDSDR